MANDVVVRFLLKGMPDVERALRSVEQAAAKAGRATPAIRPTATTRFREQAKRDAVALATENAAAQRRFEGGLGAPARMRRRPAPSAFEGPPAPTPAMQRAALEGPPEPTAAQRRKSDRASIEEAKDRVRAMIKADAEIKRIRDRADRYAEKLAQKEDQRAKSAADKAVKNAESAERKKEAARERAERKKEAARERENQKILADVRRIERAEERKLERKRERETNRAENRRERDREQFARGVGNALAGGITRGVSRVAGVASNLVSMTAQLGGGFSLGDAVKEHADLQREAVGFINASADKTGLDAKDIESRTRANALSTGTDAAELLAGSRAFLSKTGNASEALKNQQLFAEISKGTGAKMPDIANAAGILRVQNKNLSPEAMKETLLQIVRQGQLGAIEFSDLASSVGKITKSSAAYSGTQQENQAKLLGLAQVAMATSGSPGEASTAVSNVAMDAMKHNASVRAALGYKAFNERGQIAKGPDEFIADVMGKTGGNLMKIQEMGFGARSMKLFQALAPIFNEAVDNKQSGREAVLTKMRDATARPMAYSELQSNVKSILETDAEQLEAEMRKFKMAIGTGLLPELTKLLPAFARMTPMLVDLMSRGVPAFVQLIDSVTKFAAAHDGIVRSIAEHPIGALIGLEITKSFADAGLPALLKSLLTAALGGGGGVPIPGGAPPVVPPGAGGHIGTGVLADAAVAADIYNSIDTATERGRAKGGDLADRLAKGDPKAKAEMEAIKKTASTSRKAEAGIDYGEEILNTLVGGPVAAVGNVLGNRAAKALGFKGKSTRDRSEETVEAQAAIDASIVRKSDIADATTEAIMAGIREAKRQASLEVQPTRPTIDGPSPPPAAASVGLPQRIR